jgi:uncharacterized membrane protein YbhN (UPF0104 family)
MKLTTLKLPLVKGIPWSRLFCLVISLGLLGIVLQRVDLPTLKVTLLRTQPLWWLAAILAFGLACFLGTLRWDIMLKLKGVHVPLLACWRATLAGHFLNTLLLGPAGGDVAKSLLFGRWHQQPTTDILAASWLDRLAAGMGSAIFALGLICLVDWTQLPPFQLSLPRVSPARFSLIGLAVLTAGAWFIHRKGPHAFLARTWDALVLGLKRLVIAPHLACSGVLLGFLVQVHLSSVLMLCLRAVTPAPLDWSHLLWTFPVISLFTALPISVAGVGVREGSAVILLGLFGVSATDAVAASVLALVCNLAWAAGGGLILSWEESRYQATLK